MLPHNKTVAMTHNRVDHPPLTRDQAVALAESYVGAYNDRDLDAMLAVLDENIVSYPSRLGDAHPHAGHAGVREWWQTMVDGGQWYTVLIREIRQPNPDQIAVLGEIQDHGESISPWCVVVRVRGGLIVESRSYLSEPELLAQFGLIDESQ
jgi:ketosteroid isomerase-like protein